MMKTFRAKKMLDRLEREGRMNEVTPEDLDLIKRLDGKRRVRVLGRLRLNRRPARGHCTRAKRKGGKYGTI